MFLYAKGITQMLHFQFIQIKVTLGETSGLPEE